MDTITTIEPIAAKWQAFGCDAVDLDGHDVDAVIKALTETAQGNKPTVLTNRTFTTHGLDCLPADAELRGKLERNDG